MKMMIARYTTFHTVISIFAGIVLATITTPISSVDGLQFRDFFLRDSSESILFPRLRCFLAFLRVRFEPGAFEKYPIYFRDDSIFQVAQGSSYQGASNIEEYVRLAYVGTSPYYACCNENIAQKTIFLGYNDGQCEFLNFYKRKFEPVPSNTNPSTIPFQFVAGIKIYFDFKERYVTRGNLISADDFVRLIYDVILNSANTRQYICGVINGVCANTLNIPANESNRTCEEQLATLPSVDNNYYLDGKSQSCRVLHAGLAELNQDHCAHISFAPLEDPKGNILCQTSKGTLVSSLFTERELQLFKDFATSVDIDPEMGHDSNQ